MEMRGGIKRGRGVGPQAELGACRGVYPGYIYFVASCEVNGDSVLNR